MSGRPPGSRPHWTTQPRQAGPALTYRKRCLPLEGALSQVEVGTPRAPSHGAGTPRALSGAGTPRALSWCRLSRRCAALGRTGGAAAGAAGPPLVAALRSVDDHKGAPVLLPVLLVGARCGAGQGARGPPVGLPGALAGPARSCPGPQALLVSGLAVHAMYIGFEAEKDGLSRDFPSGFCCVRSQLSPVCFLLLAYLTLVPSPRPVQSQGACTCGYMCRRERLQQTSCGH